MERRVVLTTDDEDEAFRELMFRRSQAALGSEYPARYRGWDMAEVKDMVDPPTTVNKFCVFQTQENK